MAAIQGYKLYYKEEGQQESGPILLRARDSTYTIGGLGEQDLMTLSAQGEIFLHRYRGQQNKKGGQ